MTETGAAVGAPEGARAQPARPRQNPRTSAEPMGRGERCFMNASLWLSGTVAPPDHQTESPVQVQLHLEKRPLDPVFHGDIEGAFSAIHHEAPPPGLRPIP